MCRCMYVDLREAFGCIIMEILVYDAQYQSFNLMPKPAVMS